MPPPPIPSPPAIDLAIDLADVTKIYANGVHALQGISLSVRRGEIFGLLGPNGAGKSTLIKIMMTVVRPTRSLGSLLGSPVGHQPTLARVGYLPENHRFPRYLTGRQTLEFFAALSNVDRRTRRKRAAELIDLVGMTRWADARVGSYSKGMLQRVGLAQSLMNDPDLVLLDEPTDGVDPVGRRDVRDVLTSLRDRGKTIFLNSHLLGELEMVCGRIAILVAGQVASQGSLDDLTRARQRYEIEILADDGASESAATSVEAELRAKGVVIPSDTINPDLVPREPNSPERADLPARRELLLRSGAPVDFAGNIIRVATADPRAIGPIVDALRNAGRTIKRIQLVRPSLEDLFMEAVIDPATGKPRPPGARAKSEPAPSGPSFIANSAASDRSAP